MRRFLVSCHGIFNSVIYRKAWSRQVWIPVVSSSLYFWKRICSFRVDSILKWRVYIKLKVSWLRAILCCMSQTNCDRVNSGHVRTHEKNSGDAVLLIGHNNTKRFLCPIRSQHLLDHLEMVWWQSVPRGFSACAWKLSSRLFSGPTHIESGLPVL